MPQKTLTWILLATLLALQLPVWFLQGGWRPTLAKQRELAVLVQDNQNKAERNAQLRADVEDLADVGKGQAAVDERARYRLGMMKTNEVFVQLVEPK